MANEDQIEHWNGETGEYWAERDNRMSEVLAAFSEALMDHAELGAERKALDIGCGGGSQTLALAERLGSGASVTGVDISEPLLGIARARLADDGATAVPQVQFIHSDASIHDFADQRFDLLFSRFGVMFFDAPAAAFAHLRGAAEAGGRLAFCCWRELAANPFVAVPLQAALSVLPPPPRPEPRAPGPFAFAEQDYLQSVLEDAGWDAVTITARDVPMRWGGYEDFSTTVEEMVNLGPIGRLLREAGDSERAAVYETAEELLAPFYMNRALHMDGAVWFVTARNGS